MGSTERADRGTQVRSIPQPVLLFKSVPPKGTYIKVHRSYQMQVVQLEALSVYKSILLPYVLNCMVWGRIPLPSGLI